MIGSIYNLSDDIKNVDICVFQKLHWLVITIQADINEFQANTAYFITAWWEVINALQVTMRNKGMGMLEKVY